MLIDEYFFEYFNREFLFVIILTCPYLCLLIF